MREMNAVELAAYLRRIRMADTVPELQALRREVGDAFPNDEATGRIDQMIVAKTDRLAKAN